MRESRRRLRVPLVGRSLRARIALTFAIAVLPAAALGAIAIKRLDRAHSQAAASAREARAVSRVGDLLPRADDPSVARRIDRILAGRASFTQPVRVQASRLAALLRTDRANGAQLSAAMEKLDAAEQKEDALQASAGGSNRREIAYLAGAIGFALLLAALAAWRLAARVLRPLRRLQEAAALLGHERLGLRVPVEREDEIGDLARSVNDLADRLSSARTELARGALHDPITLLPNSSLLVERVVGALERTRVTSRAPILLWIGLDNFEAVRGSLGGESGDRLLRTVAERIGGCVRPADTVARVGSEGFAVLMEDLSALDEATPRAERVLAALRRRRNGGPEVIVRASIGIAEATTRDPDDLFQAASIAMQAARAQGGDRCAVFSAAMHTEASDRLSLEADLREAIERRRLSLVYQPLFDLRSGAICGLEALVRWNHPERGMISPGTFIPLAEATGLIEPLGLFVLGEACADALRLRRRGARIPVAVNLSRRQLDLPHLVSDVQAILREKHFDPADLVLEVTESAVSEDASSATERLAELRALGIRIALDDFGTGYSSLGSLKTLPIDVVKIDRSFVSDLRADDSASLEFVRTVVDLGRALGLRTVAEGIEQEDQVEVLRQLGVDEGQGFHLGKPMELGRINTLLTSAAEEHAAVS